MSKIVVITTEELETIFDRRLEVALKHYAAQQNRQTAPTQTVNEPPYVSKKEAAMLMGICVASVDNAARAGRLKRHYINGGKAVRFLRTEVLSLAVETKGGNAK